MSLSIPDSAFIRLEEPFGNAIVIDTELFINTLLPPLPSGIDLDAFIPDVDKATATEGLIVTKNGRLRGYEKAKPSQLPAETAFRPLRQCVDRIACRVEDYEPIARYFESDTRAWKLSSRKRGTFPDAGLCTRVPKNITAPEAWSVVAVSGVYHQTNSLTIKQEVRSISHPAIMHIPDAAAEYNEGGSLHGRLHDKRSAEKVYLWIHS